MKLFASLIALVVLGSAVAIGHGQASEKKNHRELQTENRFSDPGEVLRYYCDRDASGFVWSGLLSAERSAFTTWNRSPEAELFLIADSYEILPVAEKRTSNTRRFEVRYHGVSGTSDASGSIIPSKKKSHSVVFELRKVSGLWKIASPTPQEVLPVVLKDRLPEAFAP